MSDTCVEVEKLAKRFLVPKQRFTAFRMLNAWARGESFKREFWVLKDLSFTVSKGEKLALIGKNGSGKTTLLRILAGIYQKTSGHMKLSCEPSALFRCWIGFNGELSVLDNIYLFGAIYGITRQAIEKRINEILLISGLEDLRFLSLKGLSVGQLQRLAFSIFMHVESEFLIFDESFAFIDQSFAKECHAFFSRLCTSNKTAIIASHDVDFLRSYCRSALWLDNGRIRKFGPVNEVLGAYEQGHSLEIDS